MQSISKVSRDSRDVKFKFIGVSFVQYDYEPAYLSNDVCFADGVLSMDVNPALEDSGQGYNGNERPSHSAENEVERTRVTVDRQFGKNHAHASQQKSNPIPEKNIWIQIHDRLVPIKPFHGYCSETQM